MGKRVKVVALLLESWDSPCLMSQTKNGTLYYARLPQNVGKYNPAYHTIVKEYGMIDMDDDGAWEKLEVQFAHDYPPEIGRPFAATETGDPAWTGWIAPDGTFYPCRSWSHDSTAWTIFLYVYNKWPRSTSTRELEERGWIRVYTEFATEYGKATQPQLDMLYDIYQVTTNERMKRTLRLRLEEEED